MQVTWKRKEIKNQVTVQSSKQNVQITLAHNPACVEEENVTKLKIRERES